MHHLNHSTFGFTFAPFAVVGGIALGALCACSSSTPGGHGGASNSTTTSRTNGATGGSGGATSSANGGGGADASTEGGAAAPGEIPIVAGAGADAPYQFGTNPYGIVGGAFLARSPMGSDTVVLDKTKVGKMCLKGTVEMVPTPADGSHPPYSTYWGVDLGFNLNQTADAAANVKTPWMVPANVTGFWFTVEGATIPPLRFKTTPTGKDPAAEQDSCAVVSATTGVANQVPFTSMFVQCWDGPQGTALTDISKGLLDVGWQVAAATGQAYPIDFCVTHFGVITK